MATQTNSTVTLTAEEFDLIIQLMYMLQDPDIFSEYYFYQETKPLLDEINKMIDRH